MHNRKRQTDRIRMLLGASVISIVFSIGLGAYWFSKIINDLNGHYREQTSLLADVEVALNEASDALAHQTQEWKDSLLRSHDPELYAKHQAGFKREYQRLDEALAQAEIEAKEAGLVTTEIHSFRLRHENLHAQYIVAERLLNPALPLSYRTADTMVRGQDRGLRDDLEALRRNINKQINTRIEQSGFTHGADSEMYYALAALGLMLPLISFALFYRVYRELREINHEDARIRSIYSSIGDAVIVADKHGKIESLNAMAAHLTGYSNEEAVGQAVHEVMNVYGARDLQRVECPIEQVLRNGLAVPKANGMLLRSRDGNEYAIEDSAMPVHDEAGEFICAVMVFHDVSERYAMLNEVRRERELFQQTFNMAAVGMAHISMNGTWLRVNQKLCEITGYSEAELLALSFQGITHPDDLGKDLDKLQQLISGHIEFYHTEKRYLRKTGEIVWIALTVSFIWKDDGTPDYGISIIENIQARKNAERDAEGARQQYQSLFDQMPEGILLINHDMRVVTFNNEALRQLGYSAEEMRTLHIWDIDANDDEVLVQQRAQAIRETGRDEFESHYRQKQGGLISVHISVRLVHLPNGEEVFQCLFRDISEQKAATSQIEYLAYHDQLTGLPNRRLLHDRLIQALNNAHRRDALVAVLYLDLDHFKDVNDSLGHQFGDELLNVVALRLQACVRVEDTVARIGGDEFVIMLNDVASLEDAASVAQKIIYQVGQPLQLGKEELRITPSVGIAICPQDGKEVDTLLQNADAALYLAKQQGRATYRFFTAELHNKSVERLNIERLLRKAIERNELELYYQPKLNLLTGKIVGCEALIRWHHPSIGLVPPIKFIPIAEQSHLIIDIGNWVMQQACRQAAIWQQRGLDLQVAFNVSAQQFMQPQHLLDELQRAVTHSGVDPARIEIEMTESLLVDQQRMGDVLHRLCEMGVCITLDDFGTGYSSLSYLRRFPISVLKIDRSFVSDADSNNDDAQMVKTIIGMAHNLRMSLVAEGIETEAQRSFLSAQGCETGQGYLFSRPVPLAEFEALLATQLQGS